MKILNEIDENYNLSIALGFFDGVHKGHQKVITSSVEFAKQNNTKSAVITFKEHPHCFFYNLQPEYITQDRIKLIEKLGVDYLYLLDFSKYYNLNAETYLKQILINNFKPISISTGFNHNFGCDKVGTPDFLTTNQINFKYKYIEIPEQKFSDKTISSTQIREYLSNGEIIQANKMLGYKFSITAKVVHGQKLGRKIGYQTANQIYPSKLIQIPFGVYETETIYGKSITNFGIRPTISNKNDAVLETHILNFDKDIYGIDLEIKFIQKIRNELKFYSVNDLKKQIQEDLKTIF